jgi:hypothetical protein
MTEPAPFAPLVAILQLPMDLNAFCDLTAAIAKHFPDAVICEPDDDNQVVIRHRAESQPDGRESQ